MNDRWDEGYGVGFLAGVLLTIAVVFVLGQVF